MDNRDNFGPCCPWLFFLSLPRRHKGACFPSRPRLLCGVYREEWRLKVIVIKSETMGRGSDELGKQLLASLLRKLWFAEIKPDAIVFYNAGVKLLAEGAGVQESLAGLFEAGVDLVACGTCVNFFGLRQGLKNGRVSDMQEISALMLRADSVITI